MVNVNNNQNSSTSLQMNSKISSERKSTLENSKMDSHRKPTMKIVPRNNNSKIENFMEQIISKQDETLTKLHQTQKEIKTLRKNKSQRIVAIRKPTVKLL